MGYFRRPIRRLRCAEEVAEAVARQSAIDSGEWREAPSAPPRFGGQTTYLRFAVGRIEPATGRERGIFRGAGNLEASELLSDHDRGRLRRVLRWFNRNLKVPKVTSNAIFWFKSDATDCIDRVWELVRLLDAHDTLVWMMRCRDPGQIVYDDEFQVAALPQRNRRWRLRPVV